MTGDKRRAHGFTLIEMLITITIFSTLAVILSQTFVSFNRLHRKVANAAVLGQDARFITELMVRAIRNNQINYAGGTFPAVANSLALVTRDSNTSIDVAIKTPADSVCDDPAVNCLAVSVNGSTWYPVTSKHVTVEQFDVMVRPSDNPFAAGTLSNVQPFVDVVLKLKYLGDRPQDNVELQTQTGVSSRVYQR